MGYEIYCPGHIRRFTTAGGEPSFGIHFCGGCSKKPHKSSTLSQWSETIMTKVSNRLLNPKTAIKHQKLHNLNLNSVPNMEYFTQEKTTHGKSIQDKSHDNSGRLLVALCAVALVVFNIDSLQAVPLDSLRAPMTAMKKEVWSYMYVVKVAAALVGGLMSVVQQSLMPLGIGGGISAGIHFFDGVIGDGSAALIGC